MAIVVALLLDVAAQGAPPVLAAKRAQAVPTVRHKVFRQRMASPLASPAIRRSPSRPLQARAAPLGTATWQPLGPPSITGLMSFGPTTGRVTAVATDPASSGRSVFVGTADGGVWGSHVGGASWQTTTDAQATLAIGAIAVDWRFAPETVYAGTGEGNRCQDCLPGQGILKSSDGGTTWTLLGQSTFAGLSFTGLAVNGSTVVAATNGGLFISTDAGMTWPSTPNIAGRFDALSQDPAAPGHFWAASTTSCSSPTAGQIWYNNGLAWTQVWAPSGTGAPQVTRIGIGAGPNGTAYAALAECSPTPSISEGRLAMILKFVNGAQSGSGKVPGATLTDYFYTGSPGGYQGWYDNVVAVDPMDANRAVFGGVTMLATSDGGQTFTDIAYPYNGGPLHPDFHAAAFAGANALYVADDGGVSFTSNLGGTGTASDWANRSTGLAITQFYQGASPYLTNLAGGSQDNGTAGNPQGPTPSPWLSLLDGDGGWTQMIPGDRTFFGEAGGGAIFQLDYAGAAAPIEVGPCSTAHPTDPACNEVADFIVPFVMDQSSTSASSARLYTATSHVFRATNGGLPNGGTTTSLGTWQLIGPTDVTSGTGGGAHSPDFVHTMAIGSPKFHGTLVTGSRFGRVYMSTNADAASSDWIDITGTGATGIPAWSSAADTGNSWITGLAINPLDNKEVWATIGAANGGRVLHTTNASTAAWTDISSTLPPNLVVDSIAVDPIQPQNVYIGTDAGALACATCGGATPAPSWVPLGTAGLPNVRVDAITVTHDDVHLVAWTHGRGAWSLDRPYPTPAGHLEPSTLSFDAQDVNTPSAPRTVTLTSSGSSPVTVSNVTLAGDFLVDTSSPSYTCPTTYPFTLAPTAHCDIAVDFRPTRTGTRTGTLSVFDDGADSPQSTALDGVGQPAGWRSLAGVIYSNPQASASKIHHSDLFVRGTDNGLWHRPFDGTSWGSWEALGGVMNSDPAVVESTNGHIDVFTRGTDNHLWQTSWDGSTWRHWYQVDFTGIITSNPAVTSPSPGRFDVFVRGTDNQLWHKIIGPSSITNFTSADGAGGLLDSEPSATSWGGGRLDVFIRGTDKQLWHLWSADGSAWHTWTRAGDGVVGSRPTAVTWGTNRIDVFIKGSDNRLWRLTSTDGTAWSNWSDRDNRGALLGSTPGAAARGQNLIDLVIRGTDNAVWYETVTD